MEKLYFNGDIITMEGEGQYVEAVLVADGKIKAAGTYDEVAAQKGADCEIVDLQGKTLMPSFIDPHSHAASMAPMFASLCDLAVCNNFDEVAAALKKYIEEKQIPAGEMVVGINYDDSFLAEQRHPHRDLLDSVSTEHPIVIMHVSVHMIVANSLALASVNFNEDMAEIPGGEIGRYEDGRLDGYLAEAASYALIGGIFASMQQKMAQLWLVAQDMYLSYGITTVQDGGSAPAVVNMMQQFDKAGMVKMDTIVYTSYDPALAEAWETVKALHRSYEGHVKLGGIKIVLDGSPQARTAWMTEPYEGSEECGVAIKKDEEVEACVKLALDLDAQLLAHCNGDATGDQYLNAVEKMLPLSDNPNKENLRFTMIHCQTARKDQIEKMATLKMIPSIFVGHVNYWGDVHMKNFGPVRGSRVSPVKDALDAGLVYNFHTDTPVVKPDMLHAVWTAVNRVTRSGRVIGEDQRISAYDALKGITINAAYAYFEEDSKGSIKEGKRADLVVLDANPLKVDPMAIKDIKILETIKDGVTVFTA